MEEHLFRLLMRILIIIYIIFAHIFIVFLYPARLKINYINHMPWPYWLMWKDFKSGNFD